MMNHGIEPVHHPSRCDLSWRISKVIQLRWGRNVNGRMMLDVLLRSTDPKKKYPLVNVYITMENHHV